LQHTAPLDHYRDLVHGGAALRDPHQLRAVEVLDRLWHELQDAGRPGLLRRIRREQSRPVRGLYLWGSVGRGKTWLMDLFYDSLPVRQKERVHFHRFMQRLHGALKAEGRRKDPLPRIAARWSSEFRVLCLDEFFVSDIADAMLLGGLLENLFSNGVTLVTTSNIEPDGLYRDGLQRVKFLPAIELLKQHTRVVELVGDTD
jgi:cell division protein ZapE